MDYGKKNQGSNYDIKYIYGRFPDSIDHTRHHTRQQSNHLDVNKRSMLLCQTRGLCDTLCQVPRELMLVVGVLDLNI